MQQVFLNAWSALRAGSEVSDLRPWLYRIAHNAALDAVKRAGYDYDELTEALDLSSASGDEVERRWVVRETLTGVAGLPDNQREALLRTAVEGQSRAEIARDLQISEGAVRQLVHRARVTLRSAATAITPMPLVSWLAATGPGSGQTPTRIAELAVGGLGAGGGAALAKTGSVVVAAGVLAVGAGTGLEPSGSQAEAERRRQATRTAVRAALGGRHHRDRVPARRPALGTARGQGGCSGAHRGRGDDRSADVQQRTGKHQQRAGKRQQRPRKHQQRLGVQRVGLQRERRRLGRLS